MRFVKNLMAAALLTTALTTGAAFAADFSHQDTDALDVSAKTVTAGMKRWGVESISDVSGVPTVNIVLNKDRLTAIMDAQFKADEAVDGDTQTAKASIAYLANWILAKKGVASPSDLNKIEEGAVTVSLPADMLTLAPLDASADLDTLVGAVALSKIHAKDPSLTHAARPALDAYKAGGALFASTRLASLQPIIADYDAATDAAGRVAALDKLAAATVKKQSGGDEKAVDVIAAKAKLLATAEGRAAYAKAQAYKKDLVAEKANVGARDTQIGTLQAELGARDAEIIRLKADLLTAQTAPKGPLDDAAVADLMKAMRFKAGAAVDLAAMKAVVAEGLKARAAVAGLQATVAALKAAAAAGTGHTPSAPLPTPPAHTGGGSTPTSAPSSALPLLTDPALQAKIAAFGQAAEDAGWTYNGDGTFSKGMRQNIAASHVATEIGMDLPQ